MTFGSSQPQPSSKKIGETAPATFDFTSGLAAGETISTRVVAATVYSGIDAAPSAIISGAATNSGAVVSQNITAGVSGVVYLLLCTITTSLSKTLQMSSLLTVIPNAV